MKNKLLDHLKDIYEHLVENWQEEAEIAIYAYAELYHGGQWSELYEILSNSHFKPGPIWSIENEPIALEMLQELEENFIA